MSPSGVSVIAMFFVCAAGLLPRAHAQPRAEIAYLAHFGAARALESLGRFDEAVQRYEAALAAIPGAESATIALASLQFTTDARDAVQQLLDRRAAPVASPDPGRLIGYGSFFRWESLKAEMRSALKP